MTGVALPEAELIAMLVAAEAIAHARLEIGASSANARMAADALGALAREVGVMPEEDMLAIALSAALRPRLRMALIARARVMRRAVAFEAVFVARDMERPCLARRFDPLMAMHAGDALNHMSAMREGLGARILETEELGARAEGACDEDERGETDEPALMLSFHTPPHRVSIRRRASKRKRYCGLAKASAAAEKRQFSRS